MKKIIFFILILFAVSLFSEEVKSRSSFGKMKMNVEGSSSSQQSSSTAVVDLIAEKLDILQKQYLTKLNNFDKRKTDNIVNEIYDLLALLPTDVVIIQHSTRPVTPTRITPVNTDVNINLNVKETTDFGEPESVQEVEEVQVSKIQKAMNDSEFQRLLTNVKNETFADDQMSVVRIAANSKHFTCDQLIQLVVAFSFADEKIDVVRIVYPKVVDKGNAHNILGAFTYSDDKKEVEQIISHLKRK